MKTPLQPYNNFFIRQNRWTPLKDTKNQSIKIHLLNQYSSKIKICNRICKSTIQKERITKKMMECLNGQSELYEDVHHKFSRCHNKENKGREYKKNWKHEQPDKTMLHRCTYVIEIFIKNLSLSSIVPGESHYELTDKLTDGYANLYYKEALLLKINPLRFIF